MRLIYAIIVLLLGNQSFAQNKTKVSLLLPYQTATPGQTIWSAVRLSMAPGWHTYFVNPGESGAPTTIEWKLPEGISAGNILWSAPEKYSEVDLTTYVYHNEAMLLVPITLASNLPPKEYLLQAKVSWLECETQCVPGEAEISVKLQIGVLAVTSADAPIIDAARQKLPKRNAPIDLSAQWGHATNVQERSFSFSFKPELPNMSWEFYPYPSDNFEIKPTTDVKKLPGDRFEISKQIKRLNTQWPSQISGILASVPASNGIAYEIQCNLPIVSDSATNTAGTNALSQSGASSESAKAGSLWMNLLLAFFGGMILNLMPCVLPVIALKILGFVNQSRERPERIRLMGLVYGLGVLVSFVALSLLVIAVKQAGHQAGWGMQFGNPQFLIVLTIIVALVAMNLFGLFEIIPGARVMGTASELASKEGFSGAFFNGVLATLLATPCTAPMLGAALGFAILQPAHIVVLIFVFAGFGLAAPYMLLSWYPQWLRFLPKPGAWMEKFRIAMGFPMLATVVWIGNLIPLHYGRKAWWFGIFIVILAMAAWIYGEFVQRGSKRQGTAKLFVITLIAGGYLYTMESQLDWRFPPAPVDTNSPLQETSDGIAWQKWSSNAVSVARAQGRIVFVDFTADWCLTCQANKKTSIEIPSVRQKLKEINAVSLLGDYTRVPAEITAELKHHGRAGVPLVLVYPRNQNLSPIVLPELLTPGIVMKALEQASRE